MYFNSIYFIVISSVCVCVLFWKGAIYLIALSKAQGILSFSSVFPFIHNPRYWFSQDTAVSETDIVPKPNLVSIQL